MDETGFGVLEDKVVKNLIATEFLYDYLKDKPSVGIIERDHELAIDYVAEPIGVVLALLPITNPTSTALFKSIVGAKTRNAMIFRPSARAARCSTRTTALLQAAGEAAGLPPDALQVVPDPTLDVSQYLFHHPGVDLIWTTGGPKAVAATNEAGKPCISVGPGQCAGLYPPQRRRPDGRGRHPDLQDVRRLGHLPGRADACVDDAIYDDFTTSCADGRADPERAAVEALSDRRLRRSRSSRLEALGHSCSDLAGLAGFAAGDDDKVLLAPLPTDLDELAAHPLVPRS